MPNKSGIPTLQDLLKQSDDFSDSLIKQKQDELNAKSQKLYQQSVLVDPNTGKSIMGVFNPHSGEYSPTSHYKGFAPKIDPETGYVLPSSVTEQRGLEGIEQQPQQSSLQGMVNPQPQQPSRPSLNPKQKEAIDKGIDRLESDPIYKDSKATVMETQNLIDSAKLAAKNPVLAGQLGAQVAKLYEKGVLTDEDVVRYTRDASLAGRIRDSITKAADGTISAETANHIQMALEARRASAQSRMGNVSKGEVQRLGTVRGIPSNTASQALVPPAYQQQLKPSQSPEALQNQQTLQQPIQQGLGDKLQQFFQRSPTQPSPSPAPNVDPQMQRYLELKAKHKGK